MESKFFTFIKPYLSFIDNGNLYRKPFSWLYTFIAVLNFILPIYIFYQAENNRIFSAHPKFILWFLLVWIIIVLASWISFQLWWDRKTKVIETSFDGDEFVATPVFSHLIQTTGEWIGTWIGIVGFSVALISSVFLGNDPIIFRKLGLGFVKSGLVYIILMPIYGLLIIIVTRFLAEQFRALSTIANNIKRN